MVAGRNNFGHVAPGVVGAVPDGIPSWDVPPSFSERLHPGPVAQLGSLYAPGVPPQRHPEGTLPVPMAEHTEPIVSTRGANQRGTYFCRDPSGGTKTDGARGIGKDGS